jgi:hypothetical protein
MAPSGRYGSRAPRLPAAALATAASSCATVSGSTFRTVGSERSVSASSAPSTR